MSRSILDIIYDLADLRQNPQYLYYGAISQYDATVLRQNLLSYKRSGADMSEIDFIVNSPGGSPDAAYIIVRNLHDYFDKVNIIIPFLAKSAATLLSLGADVLIMDQSGEFGPLDVQLHVKEDEKTHYDTKSALIDETSLQRIEDHAHKLFLKMFYTAFESERVPVDRKILVREILAFTGTFYKPILERIKPYQLGEKKRFLDVGTKYGRRILQAYSKLEEPESRRFVDFLVNGCPDHNYIIDRALVKEYMGAAVVYPEEISDEYTDKLAELSQALVDHVQHLSSNAVIFNGFAFRPSPEVDLEATTKEYPQSMPKNKENVAGSENNSNVAAEQKQQKAQTIQNGKSQQSSKSNGE